MSESHSPATYVKIYFILLVLLVISLLGPELGIKAVTLITAFGIAIVKALMVAAYFMHLNIEKRYIWYMFYTMLLAVGLFFAGVSPDVMNPTGQRWQNVAASELMKKKEQEKKADDSGHGEDQGNGESKGHK